MSAHVVDCSSFYPVGLGSEPIQSWTFSASILSQNNLEIFSSSSFKIVPEDSFSLDINAPAYHHCLSEWGTRADEVHPIANVVLEKEYQISWGPIIRIMKLLESAFPFYEMIISDVTAVV